MKKTLIILLYLVLILFLLFFSIHKTIKQYYLINKYDLDNCLQLQKLTPDNIIKIGENFNDLDSYPIFINSFLKCKNTNVIPYIMLKYHKEIYNQYVLDQKNKYSFFKLNHINIFAFFNHTLEEFSLNVENKDFITDLAKFQTHYQCDQNEYTFWLNQYNKHILGNFSINIPTDIVNCVRK
jgi:hypothetical protein